MIRRLFAGLGIGACVLVLAISVAHVIAPQRDGYLALTQILAPYLFLALLVFLPFGLNRDRSGRWLRRLMLLCLVVFLIRFLPGTVALPHAADPSALGVPVTSWNLKLGEPDPAVVVDAIRAMPPGLVALEELTLRHAQAIAADPAIRLLYPYQVLSSWPIEDGWTFEYDPPSLSTTVTAEVGRPMSVVVAHPYRGVLSPGRFGLPTYDATTRDRAIGSLRQIIDPILAAGMPLVLVGDFNTVDREVGYGELTAGLSDAQHAVGLGPGLTWRPEAIQGLPFGLLRIDAVFSANGLVPLSVGPDCTPRGSDHCILHADLELVPGS